MKFKKDDSVKISGKILKRDKDGKAQTLDLNNEEGLVMKVDIDHVFVKTKHGVHYVPEKQVELKTV